MKQLSLKKILTVMLKRAFRVPSRKEGRLHHDLDDLAGSWTAAEAAEFDCHLAEQRQVEEGQWK